MSGFFIGIDVGGTNLKAGLVNEKGEILATEKTPLGAFPGPEGFARTLAGLAEAVLRKGGAALEEIEYVGIGIPGAVSGGEILLANRSAAKAEALAQELDCRAVDNAAVAAGADYIFLGVKPYMVAGLMEKIGPVLAARKDRFVLVSMAAALTIPDLRERGCGDWPLIRIMPNTPSAIGEGVIFYTCDGVTAEEEAAFLENMAGAGRLLPLDDHLMDAGSAVAGCGPAFVDLFIEAMADGGVACGLTRPMAMECAAQTLIGAARLMLETGRHPGALKDAVCSPGGATIQGVRALEAGGFRSAVMEAVIAAYEKSAEMK